MNSPSIRHSRVAIAAFVFLAMSATIAPAGASLPAHPEPPKLDPLPPSAAIPPAAAATSASPAVPAKPGAPPKADRLGPHTVSAREEILTLARKGWLDSAYAVCKSALALDAGNPFLLLMMGKLGPEAEESAEYFKKAIKAGPGTPEGEESLFRLGQFHYAAGKYSLAIPFFRDYLFRFPDGDWKEPAHYWMGNACLSMAQSRPDRAAYLDSGEAWFQKLLDRSRPDEYYFPLALEGLARAKAAKGDRDGAWEAARNAMEKAPEEERGPLLLLAAQLRQGVARNEEKNLMNRLLMRYPQSPEARYLRKLNAGADTSRWKSGSGLPRAVQPIRDSLALAGTAAAREARPSPGKTDSSKRVTEAPVLPKGSAAAKGYTLQLGAFSQGSNAQAMMASLAKHGLAAELIEANRGGKRMYQVRLGRFPTVEAASEYALATLKPLKFLSQPVPLAP